MMVEDETIRTLFLDIVRKQLASHASVKIPDLYLIARQAALGPAGQPRDHDTFSRLEKEWHSDLRIRRQDRLIEVIDPWGDLVRLHIRLFRKSGGDPGTLERFCTETTAQFTGSVDNMDRLTDHLVAFSRSQIINCNPDEIFAYIEAMRRDGYPPVEHSEEYVSANFPNYCVILSRLWNEEFVEHREQYRGPFYG